MASKKIKPETSASSEPAKKKKAVAPKSVVVKAEAVSAKKSAKPAPGKTADPAISTEAIARRAYYLAEERHRTATPGTPTQDWLNAEKQLMAEAGLKPESKAKKASAKSGK